MSYKRNQIEEAIARIVVPNCEEPPSELRTRIKRLMRRTICFSKTTARHDLVIGLFINRYEFGLAV